MPRYIFFGLSQHGATCWHARSQNTAIKQYFDSEYDAYTTPRITSSYRNFVLLCNTLPLSYGTLPNGTMPKLRTTPPRCTILYHYLTIACLMSLYQNETLSNITTPLCGRTQQHTTSQYSTLTMYYKTWQYLDNPKRDYAVHYRNQARQNLRIRYRDQTR